MGWEGLRRFVFHRKREMPDGLWIKCDYCKNLIHKKLMEGPLRICPECGFHFTLSSQERLKLLIDEGSFEEYWTNLNSSDPLNWLPGPPVDQSTSRPEDRKTGLI